MSYNDGWTDIPASNDEWEPVVKEHGIFDTIKGAGARMAQGVNSAAGSMLDTFGLTQGATAYKEGADYWKKIAEESGSSGIPAKIYEGIGAAPQGVAEFVAGAPYAAAKGAAKGYQDDGLKGLLKEALVESIKRYGIGKVFKGIENANMTPVQKSATMAGTMGAQTAAEGGSLQDVVASTVTGAALTPPTGGGRADVVRQRMMNAGASPDIAADLSSRGAADMIPGEMGYINANGVDQMSPSDLPPKELIRNPEQLPARTENDTIQPKQEYGSKWDDSYPAINDGWEPVPIQDISTNKSDPRYTGAEQTVQPDNGFVRNPEQLPTATDSSIILNPERQPVWDDPRYPGVKPNESEVIPNGKGNMQGRELQTGGQEGGQGLLSTPSDSESLISPSDSQISPTTLSSDKPIQTPSPSPDIQEESLNYSSEHSGQDFFARTKSGSLDFGEIPSDIAQSAGIPAAPIRLETGNRSGGETHINRPERLEQIQDAGYQNASDLIEDVSRNYNQIYRGKDGTLLLAKKNGKALISFVELMPIEGGGYYRTNTGFVARADYLKNKELLWERAQSNRLQNEAPSAVLGQSSSLDDSIIPSSENVKTPINLYGGMHLPEVRRGIARATDYLKSTKVGETLSAAWDGIQRAVSPTLRGDQAMKTGEVITEQLGRVAHETEKFLGDINRGVSELRGAVDAKAKALDLLNSSSRTLADTVFAKMPESLRLDFMQKMDTGQNQATPALQKIADTIDAMFKDKVKQVQALGTGALQRVRENYFPHIWDRSGNAEADIMSRISNNPLEGKKDFTKARVFDDVQAGLDAGYKPLSTNPMDLVMLKMAEMDKYILAHKAMQTLEGQGVTAIPFADKTPQGMTDINGRFGSFDRDGKKMRYVAEDQVAQVINNFTSQGLHNNKYVGTPYKAIRATGDSMNMFQLGFGSAFHAGFTSGEAVVSHVALGLKELARGNVKEGIKYLASSPAAMVTNAMKGDKVLKAFTGENTSADVADIVEYLKMAGAQKSNPNERYFSNNTQKLMENWTDKDFGKALARSPLAAVEQMARPIMEWLVPRHKFGVFAELAEQWARNHPEATHDRTRAAMQQIWNRVDSRLGQVVYTRLFTHNVAKNIAQMMVRAPGWTGGTILEVGGGIKDLADMATGGAKRAGKGVELSDRAAYTLSLMLVTAVTNGALTAAFTGEKPEGMDFLAFRDGGADEKGKASRFLLPTYAKDIYAYYQHPGKTLSDKTHPLFSTLAEMVRNKDYYGVQVRDPEASYAEQSYQIGKHIVKAFIPFWARGAQKTIDREGGFDVMAQQNTGDKIRDAAKIAAPIIGVMPATSAYTNSPLEKFMGEQMPKNEQAITQDDADHKQAVYGLANKLIKLQQAGASLEPISQQMREMVAKGELTDSDIKKIDKILEVPHVVRQFEKLSARAAIKAFNELANDTERQQVQEVYIKKLDRFAEDKPNQFERLKPKIMESVEHIKRLREGQ